MQWTVHGERTLYDSEWIRLALTDIEIPAVAGQPSRRFEHHVTRSTGPAAGVVVFRPDRGVLLLWRHRFIVDRWGWEIPAGKVDTGEAPEEAAAREVLEESGWRCNGPLELLTDYGPISGVGDHRFFLYLCTDATRVGEPTDPSEADEIAWVPLDRLREEIRAGKVDNGLTLTALLWCFSFGPFAVNTAPAADRR